MRREPPYVPGDHVRRTGIDYENEGMYQGEEYVIHVCDRRGNLKVQGINRWYHANHFVPIGKRADV